MKISLQLALTSTFCLLTLASCATAPKSATVEAGWLNNMHRLSLTQLHLIPLVADGRRFADPMQRQDIAKQLKGFAQTTAAIANDNKAPNADPLIAFNARSLANDAQESYAAFEMGDLQWARFSFYRTSAYCIGCHTRADRGIRDFDVGWTTELSSLNPIQTVEFLLANRRYASALLKAKELAGETKYVQSDPRAWIVTIEKAMGMVVRVMKDPGQAKELAQAVANNKTAASYLRRDAASWLKDIRDWQREDPAKKGEDPFKTAVRLVGKAQRSGPRSTSMLISYLRASGILHEQLENTLSSSYAEKLLFAGIVADSLRDLNYGYLDRFYYERCILQEPHSELAERCYERLELSTLGSDPVLAFAKDYDGAVQARLTEFKILSEAKRGFDDPIWIQRFWEGDSFDRSEHGSKKD